MKVSPALPLVGVVFLLALCSIPKVQLFLVNDDIAQAYKQQAEKRAKAIEALGDPLTRMTMNAWQSRVAACMTGKEQPAGFLTLARSGLEEARREMGSSMTEGTNRGASKEAIPKLLTLAEQKCATRILDNLALTNPASLPPLLGEIQAVGYALPPTMAQVAKRSPEPLVAVQF
jgi:hypothetical protein